MPEREPGRGTRLARIRLGRTDPATPASVEIPLKNEPSRLRADLAQPSRPVFLLPDRRPDLLKKELLGLEAGLVKIRPDHPASWTKIAHPSVDLFGASDRGTQRRFREDVPDTHFVPQPERDADPGPK
ncbi:hypothetical protein [Streptomyces sp. NPDC094466]|uniref:hypothetical protein n=1 Tax=Streptomyces sp. NPDC094466 TaxID=3366065 RepID=UPI0037FE73B5